MTVMIQPTERMQKRAEKSQPPRIRSFCSYPPYSIMQGTAAVGIGVMNAVSTPASIRIRRPRGSPPI